MGKISLRLEARLPEWWEVERPGSILDPGDTKLLERDIYPERLRDQNTPMENSYFDPEGGCGYSVQS